MGTHLPLQQPFSRQSRLDARAHEDDCASSPDERPLTFLYSGAFSEDWTDRCLAALRNHAGETSLTPIVLLPHDIQLDDYAPSFEVLHGEPADEKLRQLLESGSPSGEQPVFIDLAPDALPGDELFIPLLRERLRTWPVHLILVVAAPEPVPFPASLFHRHRRLPPANARAAVTDPAAGSHA